MSLSRFAFNPTAFELKQEFPLCLLSYASKSNNGQGKSIMWALARALQNVGITSFNGCQVKPGQDWQEEWFGRLNEALIAVILLSPEYFESQACRNECLELVKNKQILIIPLQFGMPNMSGHFLGEEPGEIKAANILKQRIRNVLPPPDQGAFKDNWEVNCESLVNLIREHVPEHMIVANNQGLDTTKAHSIEVEEHNLSKVNQRMSKEGGNERIKTQRTSKVDSTPTVRSWTPTIFFCLALIVAALASAFIFVVDRGSIDLTSPISYDAPIPTQPPLTPAEQLHRAFEVEDYALYERLEPWVAEAEKIAKLVEAKQVARKERNIKLARQLTSEIDAFPKTIEQFEKRQLGIAPQKLKEAEIAPQKPKEAEIAPQKPEEGTTIMSMFFNASRVLIVIIVFFFVYVVWLINYFIYSLEKLLETSSTSHLPTAFLLGPLFFATVLSIYKITNFTMEVLFTCIAGSFILKYSNGDCAIIHFALLFMYTFGWDFVKIALLMIIFGFFFIFYVLKLTPLHYAAENGFDKCVKLLLDAGANKDAVDKDRSTPLHFAARSGHDKCVKLLLGAGANKDAVDKDRSTPLHIAAGSGHNKCVRLLRDAGARW